MRKRWKCVGFESVDQDQAVLLSIVSLDSLSSSSASSLNTSLKLEWPYNNAGVGVSAPDSYQNIDRCCPGSNMTNSEQSWENIVRRYLAIPGTDYHDKIYYYLLLLR